MKRALRVGQIYTSHDGTELYRRIVKIQFEWLPQPLISYRTNRGDQLHHCCRKTFIEWIRVRRARKTQKYRRRSL